MCLDSHEELPLGDEELCRRLRAETLIYCHEEEGAHPETQHIFTVIQHVRPVLFTNINTV